MLVKAIILAGGLGTRLRSAVPDLPKPMADVQGRPFLAYLIDYWIQQGISHFVLSVGYKYQKIIDYFGGEYRGAVIEYAIEAEPIGTGGGLLLSIKKFSDDEPFILLNGDTYFPVNLQELESFAKESSADICLSLVEITDPNRYLGVEIAMDGTISNFACSDNQLMGMANGGVYWVHPRVLDQFQLSGNAEIAFESEILPMAILKGYKITGRLFKSPFIDIGVPQDYERAPKILVPLSLILDLECRTQLRACLICSS